MIYVEQHSFRFQVSWVRDAHLFSSHVPPKSAFFSYIVRSSFDSRWGSRMPHKMPEKPAPMHTTLMGRTSSIALSREVSATEAMTKWVRSSGNGALDYLLLMSPSFHQDKMWSI